MTSTRLPSDSAPPRRTHSDILPIDLDAMKIDDGWSEAPSWPCSIVEIKALQDGWWRALLDFILECAPVDERDAVLLGVSPIITRTIPLVETAMALERAEAIGMRLAGGRKETEYLRGEGAKGAVPVDGSLDSKAIVAARHPFIRSILSTRYFTPAWKIPFRLAMSQGVVLAHNDLHSHMARNGGPRLVFRDAGSIFNAVRKVAPSNLAEGQAANLANSLADRLIASSPIREPYRARLRNLVVAKLLRILSQTLADISAIRSAKFPNLIWGNTGGQYAARAIAIEVLRRGGETRFFTHAGTASMVHMPNIMALAELAVSSTFVLETPTAARQDEMVELCRTLAPIRALKVIGGNGNKSILNLPLKRSTPQGKRPKVVYVGTESVGFIRNGLKAIPEVIYLDWQFRLAKSLSALPIDFLCKPHPGSYFRGQPHPIETIAKTDYRRFEEIMDQADVFIFDVSTTTTIWEALCTDRKVVFLDLGLHRFHRAVDPMMRRRCRIIPTTYDDHNRPNFKIDELEAAIFDDQPVDSGEFHDMLIGD